MNDLERHIQELEEAKRILDAHQELNVSSNHSRSHKNEKKSKKEKRSKKERQRRRRHRHKSSSSSKQDRCDSNEPATNSSSSLMASTADDSSVMTNKRDLLHLRQPGRSMMAVLADTEPAPAADPDSSGVIVWDFSFNESFPLANQHTNAHNSMDGNVSLCGSSTARSILADSDARPYESSVVQRRASTGYSSFSHLHHHNAGTSNTLHNSLNNNLNGSVHSSMSNKNNNNNRSSSGPNGPETTSGRRRIPRRASTGVSFSKRTTTRNRVRIEPMLPHRRDSFLRSDESLDTSTVVSDSISTTISAGSKTLREFLGRQAGETCRSISNYVKQQIDDELLSLQSELVDSASVGHGNGSKTHNVEGGHADVRQDEEDDDDHDDDDFYDDDEESEASSVVDESDYDTDSYES